MVAVQLQSVIITMSPRTCQSNWRLRLSHNVRLQIGSPFLAEHKDTTLTMSTATQNFKWYWGSGLLKGTLPIFLTIGLPILMMQPGRFSWSRWRGLSRRSSSSGNSMTAHMVQFVQAPMPDSLTKCNMVLPSVQPSRTILTPYHFRQLTSTSSANSSHPSLYPNRQVRSNCRRSFQKCTVVIRAPISSQLVFRFEFVALASRDIFTFVSQDDSFVATLAAIQVNAVSVFTISTSSPSTWAPRRR